MFYNRGMRARPASSPQKSTPPIRKAKPAAPLFDYAEALLYQLQLSGLPAPEREFLFHSKRKWRFDFAWPDLLIAVEVEGGIWTGGRHVRGSGYEGDCEKYNTAQMEGWMVLRFTPGMLKRKGAGEMIEKAIRRAVDGDI
jgi:hypothetical protein